MHATSLSALQRRQHDDSANSTYHVEAAHALGGRPLGRRRGADLARQELILQQLHLHQLPPAISSVLTELTQLFPPDAAGGKGVAPGGGVEGWAAGGGHGAETARRSQDGGLVAVSRSVQVCVAAAVCGWHEQLLLLSHLAEDEDDAAQLALLRSHAADITAQLEVGFRV